MTEAEGRPVEACSIVVTVVGSRPGKRLFDDERFTDPETFVTRLTRQALWRWTEVSADVAVAGSASRSDCGGEWSTANRPTA
jgi:hypothetical protein